LHAEERADLARAVLVYAWPTGWFRDEQLRSLDVEAKRAIARALNQFADERRSPSWPIEPARLLKAWNDFIALDAEAMRIDLEEEARVRREGGFSR
jgi:hypothetical protein